MNIRNNTNINTITNNTAVFQVLGYMQLAVEEGGTVLTGGGPPNGSGTAAFVRGGAFLEPTLVLSSCRRH